MNKPYIFLLQLYPKGYCYANMLNKYIKDIIFASKVLDVGQETVD